jgi:HEPN domain-containing protein
MKRPKPTAKRWIEQAEHFLKSAKREIQPGPSNACFYAEQAAQAALKAYLYFQGERFIYTHSIMELAERCQKLMRSLVNLSNMARD